MIQRFNHDFIRYNFSRWRSISRLALKSQHVLYDQVTSAIAKLFRDFATLRPASEPLSRPNPLEGKNVSSLMYTSLKVRIYEYVKKICTLSKFGMDWNEF